MSDLEGPLRLRFDGPIIVDFWKTTGERWLVESKNSAVIPNVGETVESPEGYLYVVDNVRRSYYELHEGSGTLEVRVELKPKL